MRVVEETWGDVHENLINRESEEELGEFFYFGVVERMSLLRGGRIHGGILGRNIIMEQVRRDIVHYCS